MRRGALRQERRLGGFNLKEALADIPFRQIVRITA
jgi:hypothetical protein